jgi:heptosyltransferase-2
MSKKVLAIKLRALGDTVIWTSALSAVKAHIPDCELHVLTADVNKPILDNNPLISKAYYVSSSWRWELIRMLPAIRRQRYDLILVFHATQSICRWSQWAGAKQLVMHHHSWTYTPSGSLPLAEAGVLKPALERDYEVLRALGYKGPILPTNLYLTADEIQRARQQMSDDSRKVAILPGASYSLKRYPKELLAQAIQDIKQRQQFTPVILTDPQLSEEWNMPELAKQLGVQTHTTKTLREFLGLLSLCERAVANDSGPAHMAVALGLKTSILFGPTSAGDWHCYDRTQNPLLRAMVDCRSEGPPEREMFQFCTTLECSHHSCLRKISPQAVAASVSI